MQKLIVISLCVGVLLNTAFAAVARLPPQEKPQEFENENGCYVPELNAVVPPNVRYSPDPSVAGCKQYLCGDDGWTQIFSCGVAEAAPPCQVVDGNTTAPYPECCKTISCDN